MDRFLQPIPPRAYDSLQEAAAPGQSLPSQWCDALARELEVLNHNVDTLIDKMRPFMGPDHPRPEVAPNVTHPGFGSSPLANLLMQLAVQIGGIRDRVNNAAGRIES